VEFWVLRAVEQALFVRGGSLYKAVGGASWEEANETAVEQGGSLVAITSQDENDFLVSVGQSIIEPVSYLDYEDYRIAWIGLFKADTWLWSTTEELEYTNWVSGNPSGDGNHAEISLGTWTTADGATGSRNAGDWNDAPSDGSYPYVSQGIAEIPFIRRGDSAYVIVEGSTWEEAEANANALGGHLVTINDAEENKWLRESFSLTGIYPIDPWRRSDEADLEAQSYWIGLSDKLSEGNWAWTGEDSDFRNWMDDTSFGGNGTPNGGTSENYAYLGGYVDGTWDDQPNNSPVPTLSRGIAEIKLAPNNSPTGSLLIEGDVRIGQQITLNKDLLVDADNHEYWTPEYGYSWEISDDGGSTWQKLITGDATDGDSTYTITLDNANKEIRGVVSYLDGYGTQEEVSSDSYSIGSIADVSITGLPRVGEYLKIDSVNINLDGYEVAWVGWETKNPNSYVIDASKFSWCFDQDTGVYQEYFGSHLLRELALGTA